MNCRDFEGVLEGLLDGTLGGDEHARCVAHAALCPSCRELVEPMGLALAPTGSEPPPSLVSEMVAEVLARTSGLACTTAEESLCVLVDGDLATTERDLAEGHLAGCEPCRGLAVALRELATDLPLLAEAAPGPAFVRDVMRATLPPRVSEHVGWAEWWRALLLRPRFAAETAYVGVVLLCLTFATPGSPFGDIPRVALTYAARPGDSALGGWVETLDGRAADALHRIRRARGVRAIETTGAGAVQVARQGTDRVRVLVEDFRSEAGTLLGRATSLPKEAAKEVPKETPREAEQRLPKEMP